mmetsp:Transcript_27923/g.54929  ORF Transcript_27923/g.54929 Transcript_27923/m.54929 type:complete len:128 (+) Transcript_27923:910-1293(+)
MMSAGINLARQLPVSRSKTSAQIDGRGRSVLPCPSPLRREAQLLAPGNGKAITTLAGIASARDRATSSKARSSSDGIFAPRLAATKVQQRERPDGHWQMSAELKGNHLHLWPKTSTSNVGDLESTDA